MMHNRRSDERIKRRRLLRGEQPLSRLFPNMITIAGLCCGLSAVRFAMLGRFEIAVAFILAAALIDGMDGRVARMLGATSNFGAQLDSLSDFMCFGVAPALIIYNWQLQEVRSYGWIAVLFFVICTALRLARFNTALFDDNKQPWESKFFTGIPSPAGGMLCLLPIVLSFEMGDDYRLPAIVTLINTLMVGALMASRIPTFSAKKVNIKHETIPIFMMLGGILLATFIIEPWMFLSGASVVYLVSIIFSVRQHRRYKAADAKAGESPVLHLHQ